MNYSLNEQAKHKGKIIMTQVYQNSVDGNFNPINTKLGHSKLSKNYKHCNSQNIIDFVESKGFNHVTTSYGKPRKEERKGFQKHIMIFENENFKIDENNTLQLLITNSHDGSTSLKMNIGVYRAICANGLVAGDTFFSHRVIHMGNDFFEKVNHGLGLAIEKMPMVAETVRKMKDIELTYDQIETFKKVAIKERLKDKNLSGVFTGQIDQVKRIEDKGNDLYTVFNRIQESTIRGGVKYSHRVQKEENGQKTNVLKFNTTREIKAIDKKTKLNQFLFNYAAELLAA